MRGIKKVGFILMILSVTACAPVVYDASYGAPARSVYVRQPAFYNDADYRPIEVFLYADNSYMGVYFQPMHLVIYDGQYVAIPVRDRRGRNTTIYAHYHQNNLHFDADRNDHGIRGSSRFNYDKRWEKGHKYSNINAGKDYDLSGLQMQIRNAPAVSEPRNNTVPEKQNNGNNRSNRTRELENNASAKQIVPVASKESQQHKVAENKDRRPNERQITVVTDKTVQNEVKNRDNYLIINNKSVNIQTRSDKITAKRPAIVEKIIKNEQLQQASVKSVKGVNKIQTANRNPAPSANVKEARKNNQKDSGQQKVSSDVKMHEKNNEHDAVSKTEL